MVLRWNVKYQMHTQEYKDVWLILQNTSAPWHSVLHNLLHNMDGREPLATRKEGDKRKGASQSTDEAQPKGYHNLS